MAASRMFGSRIIRGPSLADDRVGRFVAICLAIGAVALIAAAIAVVVSLRETHEAAARVTHSYAVMAAIDDYRVLAERSETARRGAILSRNPAYVVRARTAAVRLVPAAARLARLTEDMPPQVIRARALERLGSAQRLEVERTVSAVSAGESAGLMRAFDGGTVPVLQAVRDVSQQARDFEATLLVEREERSTATRNRFYALLALAAAIVMVVTALALLATWRALENVRLARRALADANSGLEARVAERTADLSRANEEIQRFAYIVSHDLRSPLVNVMGFTGELEAAIRPLDAMIARVEAAAPALADAEARAAVRADLPEAIGFIRGSTQKMDRLINAILTLSRQGRRVLNPEPLDLAAMIAGIGDSLAHRIDEIGAELRVEGDLPALVHDRLAVEQILSNLIENAVKYRQPDRPLVVTVTGEASGVERQGRVSLSVADNGRGIDARDHTRIFDLFRRSGAQTEPGEGIGLAHVRALAFRMGGTIDCTSEIGQGSTFTLQLPAKFEGEGASDR